MTRGPFYDVLDTKDSTELSNGTLASFEQPLTVDRHQHALMSGFGGPPIMTGCRIVGTSTVVDTGPPVIIQYKTTRFKFFFPWQVQYCDLMVAATGDGYVFIGEDSLDTLDSTAPPSVATDSTHGSRLDFNVGDNVLFTTLRFTQGVLVPKTANIRDRALYVHANGNHEGTFGEIQIQVPEGVTLWGVGFIPHHELY